MTRKKQSFIRIKIISFLAIKFLPFQQLQALWTLFSEFFSSFPHGTCALSVSHTSLFSLRWSIPPKLRFFKLHSQATWLVHKGSTGLRPRCLAIPSFIRFAYGSITLYSSFFQTKRRKPCWIPQSNQLVLRTWPFVYTTSLRSIPARRKFSAWARSFLFIRHYSGNHRYFLFPPLIKMLQFSGLLLFKLKLKRRYVNIHIFNFF